MTRDQSMRSAAHNFVLHDFNADYRPGNLLTVSTGLRYVANPKVVPQLQFNFTRKSADQGALADTISGISWDSI